MNLQEENLTFEEALNNLEAIVSDLERGNVPLEESLKKFEEGIALSRICASKLKSAEEAVKKLVASSDGTISLENFKLNESEEEENNPT